MICCSYDGTIKVIEWEDGELGMPQSASNQFETSPLIGVIQKKVTKTSDALNITYEKAPHNGQNSSISDSLPKKRRIQPTLIQSYDTPLNEDETNGSKATLNSRDKKNDQTDVLKASSGIYIPQLKNTPQECGSLPTIPILAYKAIIYLEPFHINQQNLSGVYMTSFYNRS